MKSFQIAFSVAVLCSLSACQSNSTSPATSIHVAKSGGLKELEGTWVGHTESGFTLLKIDSNSTGTYTGYTDREKKTGKDVRISRHWLYESPIRVKYVALKQEPNVFIETQRFRFDYALRGDTLQEIDKMGLQGALIRVKPEQP
ncbi:hypothetical protein DNI29_09455 [Hymenobacter sediminis]|uniref:hypothetical protein n=1 Tax=Hymenobacter sediminis TaxID=2218621 RepID=UPI000F4DBE7B|nr:hypothetical protein [Hymenobacter sediminis]RPD47668.1 hypothetical protein DNI29_09455 [Hymenobacter sediminis]